MLNLSLIQNIEYVYYKLRISVDFLINTSKIFGSLEAPWQAIDYLVSCFSFQYFRILLVLGLLSLEIHSHQIECLLSHDEP